MTAPAGLPRCCAGIPLPACGERATPTERKLSLGPVRGCFREPEPVETPSPDRVLVLARCAWPFPASGARKAASLAAAALTPDRAAGAAAVATRPRWCRPDERRHRQARCS